MTKEEIIQAITDDKMMPFIQPEQLAEIVDFVIKNYKPSLPSNLDEAVEIAKELAYKTWSDGENWGDAAIKTFKAAVEWMTGQGYIKEGVARPDNDEIWVNLKNTDIKDGDKVVVQIRKK